MSITSQRTRGAGTVGSDAATRGSQLADGESISIHEAARLTGLTSRTLRHYDQIGLLSPSGIGSGGIRRYDGPALVRLQRILLLRDLGLSLAEISRVLAGERDERAALQTHLAYLRAEQDRVTAQIRSVTATISHLQKGAPLMAQDMFDGFDHTQYKDEVIERWGHDAYAKSDSWYRSLTPEQKQGVADEARAITEGFAAARAQGLAADDESVQELTARHFRYITMAWGSVRPTAEQFAGLGQMYTADPRFRANYDQFGEGTAELVRDAMAIYAEANL